MIFQLLTKAASRPISRNSTSLGTSNEVHKGAIFRKRRIAILFTPHTPRPRIILMIAVMLVSLSSTITKAQIIYSEAASLDTLEASLKYWHNQKWQAERGELIEGKSKKWWYYLPSVGLQFGLPSIQFGTGTLAVIDRDKRLIAARLEGIDRKAQLDYNTELQQLRLGYQLVLIQARKEGMLKLIRAKEKEIFQIQIEGYQKKGITPEEFKNEELKNLRAEQVLDNFSTDIQIQVLHLYQLAHWAQPSNPLWYDPTIECEVLTRDTANK